MNQIRILLNRCTENFLTVNILALAIGLRISFPALADNLSWTQFRGRDGNGIAPEGHAPLKWSESENIAWRTAIEGKGWSSPVVAENTVYLTTAVVVEANEQEAQAILEATDLDPKQFKDRNVAKSVLLKLISLDLTSGKPLASKQLISVETPEPIHAMNSYASPTPMLDDDRIYCHFGTYGTFCLNRGDLSIRWERRLPLIHSVGPGSSPLVIDDILILICDGVDRQYVTGLNKRTGETVWERDRPPMEAPSGDMKKAFCTPISVTDPSGRKQVICMGSQWIVSYEPGTGNELWKLNHGKGFSIVPRPVYAEGVVYFSTGFGKPELWAVRADGAGDVTDTNTVWIESRRIPARPSPLLVGELLFIVSDDGIASCFDAKSGESKWSERLGGNFSASPLLADGKIFFCNHEGKTTVIRPSGSFAELANSQLDGQIMASPVAVDDSLLIRTDQAMYRIQSENTP